MVSSRSAMTAPSSATRCAVEVARRRSCRAPLAARVQTSRKARIIAATSTSPRRCASWNSGRRAPARPARSRTERRRAFTRAGPPPTPSRPRARAAPVASGRRTSHPTRRTSPSGAVARVPSELAHDLGEREHRQQRDDVGERLVEGRLVRRRRRHESAPRPSSSACVVSCDDDVVRQTREDSTALGAVVAEHQRLALA